MQNDKLNVITNLFEGRRIRSVWDSEKEEYYFSVVDVISALTESTMPKRYWSDLKKKLIFEGSELYDKIVQLKMQSQDGKYYKTDTLDTKGIFRLIESIPSPKAEPFKLCLANLGSERIDEVFDPEIAINRAIEYYEKKGYDDEWIKKIVNGIITRKKLTDVWKKHGITEGYEFAMLTNEIYKEWSGLSAKEYKEYKGLRKESLRDNMNDIEIVLADLGEISTRELTQKHKPYGLDENKEIAKKGGNIAKNTRSNLEKELGKKIITNKNYLNYKYFDDQQMKPNNVY